MVLEFHKSNLYKFLPQWPADVHSKERGLSLGQPMNCLETLLVVQFLELKSRIYPRVLCCNSSIRPFKNKCYLV